MQLQYSVFKLATHHAITASYSPAFLYLNTHRAQPRSTIGDITVHMP